MDRPCSISMVHGAGCGRHRKLLTSHQSNLNRRRTERRNDPTERRAADAGRVTVRARAPRG